MKRYILLLIALVTLALSAQNVSQEQARQTAMNFLKEAGVQSKLAPLPAKAPAAKGATTESPLYYVFNAEDGKAHAIVSAVHNEVIGYSPTNALDAENMPENMKWYVAKAARNGIIKSSAKGRRTVSPMVSTQWGQGGDSKYDGNTYECFEFNAQCPIDPATGERSLTGCVPTALAQIMKKWEHPAATTVTIPGYKPQNFSEALEPLSPTSFDWGAMRNVYYPGEEGNAVTTLMKYLGWGCRADYGSEGTGCVSLSGETAANLYFDYYGRILSQEDLSEDEWDEIIYNEINSGRPVYLGGVAEAASGAKDASGHCFVADGYNSNDHTFHMNWGWDRFDFFEWLYLFKSTPHTAEDSRDLPYHIDAACMVGMVPRNKVTKWSVTGTDFELYTNDVFRKFGKIGISSYPHVLPSEAFRYKVFNPSVATVDIHGMITAVGTGETDIEISLGEVEETQYYYAGYTPQRKKVHVKVVTESRNQPYGNLLTVDKYQVLNNRLTDMNTWGFDDSQLDVNGDGVIDADDGGVLKGQFVGVDEGCTPEGNTYAGGYEYVDLGLPSGNKWATKNVGAAAPEDAGYYFAWGEECTKLSYTPETSYTYQKNSDALIATGMAKEKDGRMQFTSLYDAAAQIWRGNWVVPTLSDMEELTTKCDWYWEILNGERGYRVVGPNGQSIFLPTGGRKNLGAVVQTDDGCYWLNDATLDQPATASALYFNASQTLLNPQARFHGFNMRAIIKGIEHTDPTPTDGTHEYVDLGLSVKWATCNVGASFPEDYGDYYAWGETETKDMYNWNTLLDRPNGDGSFTKYYHNGGKTQLDPEDDAAHVNWGGTWRMPTKDEFYELYENCIWTWTSQNGVNGCKVIGPNGNSIFLPAAGYRTIIFLDGGGSTCTYSTSSLEPPYDILSYTFYFDSNTLMWHLNRWIGQSVRPVCP